jgi:hypothetical protein
LNWDEPNKVGQNETLILAMDECLKKALGFNFIPSISRQINVCMSLKANTLHQIFIFIIFLLKTQNPKPCTTIFSYIKIISN